MSEQVIVEDEIVTVVSVGVQGAPGPGLADTDQLTEGSTNRYFTDARARSAAVADAINDGVTNADFRAAIQPPSHRFASDGSGVLVAQGAAVEPGGGEGLG
jgi:hypothetical protein